ncbi:glycosyltransferase, partial [Frisingicoccus sp.]
MHHSKQTDSIEDCAYEIVFVNDGSKDGSYEVMQELAAMDENR